MPALEGMRVLDMTQYEAGTSCTQHLAWLGAEVVKVEPPTGDVGRRVYGHGTADSQYFLNYNANKQSVVIDLASEHGRDLLLRLAPKFDVFVENYGPGVVEKLRIGYDVMRELNPRIIYARIKGFGLSGPYAGYKSFDALAQATAGLFSVTGDPDGPPMRPGGTFGDSGTGMQTALAITAAYVQQQRSGEGQLIEISMQEVATMFLRTVAVTEWAQGVTPRRGSRGGAPSGQYPCKPGGPNDYVFMLVGTTRMWDALCAAIDRADLLTDPRFEGARARSQHVEELNEAISSWTRERTKHDVMRILGEAGVACAAVLDTADIFCDPHLKERGFIQQLEHPGEGTITLMGSPMRLSKSEVPLVAPPTLGQDTDRVLRADLGLSDEEVAALREEGAVR